jgi:type IV pilus assembly protein PilY1
MKFIPLHFVIRVRYAALAVSLVLFALISSLPRAELADLSNVPLSIAPADAVRPNMMFILDDSGSMLSDFMPENVTDYPNCKKCTSTTCAGASNMEFCNTAGLPPRRTYQFNQLYYNPNFTYAPAVNHDGTSLGAQGAPWTMVKVDPFLNPATTTNITTQTPEIIYCNTNSAVPADYSDPAKCKRNGIHNGDFLYYGNSGANVGFPQATGTAATTFRFAYTIGTGPYYYTISPVEYCDTAELRNCVLATAPAGAYVHAAPLRYCGSAADAQSAAAVSGPAGGAAKCQFSFNAASHTVPRYGKFTRVNITEAGTYPKAADSLRTDCAAAGFCTGTEEMTNYANWYAYYRTRILMMKSATSRAFLPVGDRYRIGFITINPGSPVVAAKYLPIDVFNTGQRTLWYSRLFSQNPSPVAGTPLRQALSRVGRHYAGITTGINDGMPQDPLTHSCQQNFALLTTDGYWNGAVGQTISDGSAVDNQDNTDAGYTTRAAGAYDGGLAGSTNTLADVAAYYYKTDLRAAGPKSEDNVPNTDKDTATHQHMTTFTLGLGLEGLMRYIPDYETNTAGDYRKIVTGATGCTWAGGTCNWPVPVANSPTALDDLWHAAVNGRGKFFSAANANTLAAGIADALASVNLRVGAAAASAVSTPNVTETDNAIFSTTFRTVEWDGQIVAQRLDTTTGEVLPKIEWQARELLNGRVSSNSDTRSIHTFSAGAATKLKPFLWAQLSNSASGPIVAERSHFEDKCDQLSQCPTLSWLQKGKANNGANMVDYLRGQTEHEPVVYRDREHALGDTVNATPIYVQKPRFNFQDVVTPDYANYKVVQASRQGVLYAAANDGMLHAFNGDTGQEMWAYVPRIVFPRLHKLASSGWGTAHEYLVDGSPQVMDVFVGGEWKTVLIAGLNKGGRGYYALDITNPASPKALWEICADNTVCAIVDNDMGYSFGMPVITKRAVDGKWVAIVTSGVNNVSPGDGKGYLYVLDLESGAILSKVATGAGDTTTPSGFAKISVYADNFFNNNTGKFVYGGDLLGNVWRFNLNTLTPTVIKLAELRDAGGKPQSVTTRPELGLIEGFPVVYIGTGRYLGGNDFGDPATLAPPLPWAYQQSFYAIKDAGVALGNARAPVNNMVQQTITNTSATSRGITDLAVDWGVNNGWFVDFNPGSSSPGERLTIDPQLILGTLLIITNVPSNNLCTIGGDSWVYQLNYRTGAALPSAPLDGGKPRAGTKLTGRMAVGVVVVQLPNRTLKANLTDLSGKVQTIAIGGGGLGGSARRVSWRELIQ